MPEYRSFSLYKRSRKSGKPVYYVQFRLPDGSRTPGRSTGQTSKGSAERRALEQLQHGKIVKNKNTTLADFTGNNFFDYGGYWAMDVLATGKRLSPRQCSNKNAQLRNHILPAIGNIRISDINKAVIKQLRNDLYRQEYAPSTINKILSCLHQILEAAEDHELISGVPSIQRVADTWTERGTLTVNEVKTLFSEKWDNFIGYAGNLLAANTGTRKSEILGLQLKSVNFADMTLNINQVFDREMKTVVPKTKSGKPRIIPFSDRVGAVLQKLTVSNPYNSPDSFLFYSLKFSNRPIHGRVLTESLYKQLEKIGITETDRKERHIDFHSWRHWMNTALVNEKIPLPIVKKITGHLTQAMTDRYYHADDMDAVRQLQSTMFIQTA